LQPIIRRRITAWGVQPVATVWPRFDNFYLFGAVEPTTGDSFFLELPFLNKGGGEQWNSYGKLSITVPLLLRPLFLLGVKSGFRISELLALQVGDVWRGQRVVERVTVRRRHMKRQLEGRTVLLHPEARAALAA
jgi:hypothetical protein